MESWKRAIANKIGLILRGLFATAVLVSTILYFMNRDDKIQFATMSDLVGSYEHYYVNNSDSVLISLDFQSTGYYVIKFSIGGVRLWSVSGSWGRLVTGEIGIVDSACFSEGKFLIGRYVVVLHDDGIILVPLQPILCTDRENKLRGYWERTNN